MIQEIYLIPLTQGLYTAVDGDTFFKAEALWAKREGLA
jgi:hypothetical protein